jgi:hypothetical protein
MIRMTASNLLPRLSGLAIIAACVCALAIGCEKESPVQPSKPAPRSNNKTVDDASAPVSGASTRPSSTTAPAMADGATGDRVEMGGRPTAVAPTTAPASSSLPQVPTGVPQAPISANPEVASFAGLTGPKPTTWQFRQPDPTKTMRVAEYGVPGVEGASQADIVVFQFPGGGSAEDNINRWKGQVRNADGSPAEAKVETFEADGMKITVAELAGEYRGMGSAHAQPDHILIASMIESDGNPVFVQLAGPSKTVAANREAFLNMLRGIKRTDPMK